MCFEGQSVSTFGGTGQRKERFQDKLIYWSVYCKEAFSFVGCLIIHFIFVEHQNTVAFMRAS
jgi:hypothetical protein